MHISLAVHEDVLWRQAPEMEDTCHEPEVDHGDQTVLIDLHELCNEHEDHIVVLDPKRPNHAHLSVEFE